MPLDRASSSDCPQLWLRAAVCSSDRIPCCWLLIYFGQNCDCEQLSMTAIVFAGSSSCLCMARTRSSRYILAAALIASSCLRRRFFYLKAILAARWYEQGLRDIPARSSDCEQLSMGAIVLPRSMFYRWVCLCDMFASSSDCEELSMAPIVCPGNNVAGWCDQDLCNILASSFDCENLFGSQIQLVP